MDDVSAVAESAPQTDVVETNDAPSSGGESSTPADSGGTDEQLPFGKHPRWQKMVAERNKYKTEMAKHQARLEQLKGASEIDGWFREDPIRGQKFMEWYSKNRGGQSNEVPQQRVKADPNKYKDFSPEVAEKFMAQDMLQEELAELRQWKTDFEKRQSEERAANEQLTVTQVRQDRDLEFVDMLKRDGYITKEGNFVDEKAGRTIERAVLSALMEIAADPKKPTSMELKTAYNEVVGEGVPSLAKFKMRSQVKEPSVPASGSRSGNLPPKGKETEAQRIQSIMDAMG